MVFSPKASVLYRPIDNLGLRLSVGRGFRAPSVQDLYETLYGHADDLHFRAGNVNLKPEYSTGVTSGIEWRLIKSLSVMVHGYYNRITDMITPVHHGLEDPNTYFPGIKEELGLGDSVYIYQRENIHNAMIAGGEIMARLQLFERLTADGGFSLVHNKNLDTEESLPYYPGRTGFFKLAFKQPLSPRLSIHAFTGVKTALVRKIWLYKEKGAQVVHLDNYKKVDAGLGLQFFKYYELFFKAENLLGQKLHLYEDKELRTSGDIIYTGTLRVSL
jgi:outer membrane receptor protein involved in Fe transport